jgi:hypothetical protein
MVFSACLPSFQKSLSPALASRAAIFPLNAASSKTPPGFVDFRFEFFNREA